MKQNKMLYDTDFKTDLTKSNAKEDRSIISKVSSSLICLNKLTFSLFAVWS
jgi:hypothetical protein